MKLKETLKKINGITEDAYNIHLYRRITDKK